MTRIKVSTYKGLHPGKNRIHVCGGAICHDMAPLVANMARMYPLLVLLRLYSSAQIL
jgi:hypothetical protein